jgi:hypothetical protein
MSPHAGAQRQIVMSEKVYVQAHPAPSREEKTVFSCELLRGSEINR